MKRYAHVLLPILCSIILSSHVFGEEVPQPPQNETDIILALAKALPIHGMNTTEPNPCLSPSITCSPSPNSHIIALSLPGSTTNSSPSTTTTVFSLLCGLNSLQSLNLSMNFFTSIPSSFFTNCTGLSGLKSLDLSMNGLTGPLYSFSAFPALEYLDLSHNFFEGIINSQLEGLFQLKILNLSFNNLTGTIPSLKALNLEELVLSSNQFDGGFPDDVLQFKNLTVLDLSVNRLSGSVPDGIGGLSNLQILLLSSNLLTGGIPSGLSNIKSLFRFAANQNKFNGSIPAGITRNMQVLDLSYNSLTGEIPFDLLLPPNLTSVDLTFNHLEGHIPMEFSNSSYRLYRLRLGQNSLVGGIPQAIGNLSSLTYLELDGNNLDSEIPAQLERCKNLTLLNLASNRLRGELPKELGSLQQLVVMKLQMNNLSGEIPDQMFMLSNLNTLNLSWNSLSGVISSSISNLQKLSILNLEGNKLNGSIPRTIADLPLLIELQLGSNELGGTIPTMPTSLTTALNLSSNHLSGSIPSSLGYLIGLEVLDLSNNNITGDVPSSLIQMKSLIELVLSNNQLSGVLPNFPRWVAVSYAGNKDLGQASEGTTTTSSLKKNHSVLFIIVAIVSGLVGFGSVAVILLLLVSKRFYRVEDVALQSEENPPQIVSGCLLTSNSLHRSSIDFTKAVEATGNPANLVLKTRFSTYYKAEMPSGVSYSIKKLDWSDKIFQTGNHGRFRRELEALGRLSSSNVMVPLAYVLTKDSAYLFYEQVHKGTVFDFLHNEASENALDWLSRYSIALGVAQGMAFLHGCADPVLLLDLTTKSIHLKSLKEPQIGDIELCKVIDPTKSTGSLSTIAGSVGYIPPEYAYTMRVTMSGNVYSFGVVLLELLTGRPAVSGGIELAKRALSYSSRLDESEQILDPRISRTSLAVRSQMLTVFKIALECVYPSPGVRPKMRNVLMRLSNAR